MTALKPFLTSCGKINLSFTFSKDWVLPNAYQTGYLPFPPDFRDKAHKYYKMSKICFWISDGFIGIITTPIFSAIKCSMIFLKSFCEKLNLTSFIFNFLDFLKKE